MKPEPASPIQPEPPCKHEQMWFSRELEGDTGRMHYFCENCGKRDDQLGEPAIQPESAAQLEERAKQDNMGDFERNYKFGATPSPEAEGDE